MIDRGSERDHSSETNGTNSDRRSGPLLKSKALAAIASATAIAALAAVIVQSSSVLDRGAEPEPVAADEQRLSKNSAVFSIEGRDRRGRAGAFDIVVLDNDIAWVRESANQLQKNGVKLLPGETVDTVLDDEIRDALTGSQDIIAVGTASGDGDPAEQTERAGRRAKKTAEIVSSVVAAWVPVWSLNLGLYREPCVTCETAGTSWKRPFVFVAVRSLEPDANLEESLRDAMSGKSNLPSPSAYSEFTLTRLR